jgi:hypothetical protein
MGDITEVPVDNKGEVISLQIVSKEYRPISYGLT